MKNISLKTILGTILTSLLIVFTSCKQVSNSHSVIIRSAYNSGWIEELFQTNIVNIATPKKREVQNSFVLGNRE
ncbi:hypothetical protein [Hydrocoleum sp. CS-953]|uniref:hypothetical protein n=1 Tax=Microcoleaceae TaxID=1892252 RepID=UPI000BD57411|nr:hypothetical protein [Hydrocoleum sp. CS-953]OZH54969.1 hypothetical protein AFK68_07515 [Hydrocoleum sp. CS-953]